MTLTERFKRAKLGHFPTSLEPLPRLTLLLGGPEIWIKRDDQTGLAAGGNKTRALEFLIADALSQRADTVLTAGSYQSNHARQTAAAAARSGLACTLALRGPAPVHVDGNLLMDILLGADIRWVAGRDWASGLRLVSDALVKEGRHPYIIPYGGSSPVGITGYVAGMEEVLQQAAARGVNFDRVVFASASGGFQAGLALGAHALDFKGQMLGIAVEMPRVELEKRVVPLADQSAQYLGLMGMDFAPDDFSINDDYLGGGYGVIGDMEPLAIRTLAEAEGILVDPVYTGRAFGGLLDLIRRREIGANERILFWHSGGLPGLFMSKYTEALVSTQKRGGLHTGERGIANGV
jgi:D-cysteine desulfhydrase